ncbi:MAG: hypothetical protein O3B01_16840 [Planctomycetota bacterium]|nr:hypothetical protein [Planctomycetota bacterium]MDA1140243.1 hypothetical protein [Planctomycetota bacterium]
MNRFRPQILFKVEKGTQMDTLDKVVRGIIPLLPREFVVSDDDWKYPSTQ